MNANLVGSKSLQCTPWVDKDSIFLHAEGEDSDQTGHNFRAFFSNFGKGPWPKLGKDDRLNMKIERN